MLKYKDKFSYSLNPLMYVQSTLINGADNYYSYSFMTLYGEKWLAPFVENLFNDSETPYEILGMLIQNKFNDTWNKIFDTLQIEYNPLTDYLVKGTEQTTRNDSSVMNTGNIITEKTTSFDSAVNDFIDDNKTTSDINSTNNSSVENNLVTQKEGLIGRTPIQEYIKREIALRMNNNIKDIIIKNTIDYITLPIY